MKNVSCFQLSIERSRAPKKMGTFKDISLFGNFIFPLQGEFAGGIIAHSLAGIGKVVKKTKAQIQKITTRNSPWLAQQALPSLRNYQYHKPEKRAYKVSPARMYIVYVL